MLNANGANNVPTWLQKISSENSRCGIILKTYILFFTFQELVKHETQSTLNFS